MAKMVTCKTCSKEVAASAKVCPGCGAKLKAGFFKKAILGVVGFIIVIAIIANMGKDKPATEASTKAGTETKKDAAPVQQELSKEGVSSDVKIVVDGFESKAEVGDNQFSKAKAQGAFKIVKVTLTNNQKDAITIDGNSFKLIDDQKREFSYSTEAQIALESSIKDKKDSFFLKKLNPGLSATGYVVFDVPADAKGFVLEASGGFTGKKIKLKVE
ncbi:DUF4352 domain-containing protein [Paenibacillus chitinolyticus]|uniref:DUF4352 domain-containing protein n=1 Tax=Paenibacillus chitinolyticus TaxID=79263 RepID=UPI00362B3AAC